MDKAAADTGKGGDGIDMKLAPAMTLHLTRDDGEDGELAEREMTGEGWGQGTGCGDAATAL